MYSTRVIDDSYPLRFWLTRGHCWGGAVPHQSPLGSVASIYADVRNIDDASHSSGAALPYAGTSAGNVVKVVETKAGDGKTNTNTVKVGLSQMVYVRTTTLAGIELTRGP